MTIRTKTNSLQEVSTLGIMWSNDRHEIEKCFSTDTVDRRRPDTGGTHNRRGGGSNTPLPYKVVALTHAHAHARERTTVAEQWELRLWILRLQLVHNWHTSGCITVHDPVGRQGQTVHCPLPLSHTLWWANQTRSIVTQITLVSSWD